MRHLALDDRLDLRLHGRELSGRRWVAARAQGVEGGVEVGELPLRARSDPETAAQLTAVQSEIESVVEREVTHSFRRAFLYSAGFALLVVPLLVAALLRARRTRAP